MAALLVGTLLLSLSWLGSLLDNASRHLRTVSPNNHLHHNNFGPPGQPHSNFLSGTPASQVPRSLLPYAYLDDTTVPDNPHSDAPTTPTLLHFVHTRFMQEQGQLTALAWARAYLWQIFCLPTMVGQSVNNNNNNTTNFMWLIRFDPDLDAAVLQYLIQLTQHYASHNIYWIASNHNFRINQHFPGAWRDGAQAADLRASRIYTGDLGRLHTALAHVHTALLLETRLDADDGLHTDYLATVQAAARRDFVIEESSQSSSSSQFFTISNNTTLRWKYWCAGRHLEWHWTVPHGALRSRTAGTITAAQNEHQCITPGITVAFPVGVAEADVPVFAHHELWYRLQQLQGTNQSCSHDAKAECLALVQTHAFEAVRSRTPTSAGMLAILGHGPDGMEENDNAWFTYATWDILYRSFGLSRIQIRWMQAYLTRHLQAIGQDNLKGQCTSGHSCKLSAKRDLERLVAFAAQLSEEPDEARS